MIEINNLTTNPIDEKTVRKTIETVLKGEGKEKEHISIAFIGPNRMRKLNKKYKDKNRATDILSFSEGKTKIAGKSLGELVICPRQVKKNSEKFGSTYAKELCFCLIHGVLHLLGHDHEKGKEKAKKMEEKEKHYLSQNFKP